MSDGDVHVDDELASLRTDVVDALARVEQMRRIVHERSAESTDSTAPNSRRRKVVWAGALCVVVAACLLGVRRVTRSRTDAT